MVWVRESFRTDNDRVIVRNASTDGYWHHSPGLERVVRGRPVPAYFAPDPDSAFETRVPHPRS